MKTCCVCRDPIDKFSVNFEGDLYCMKCASFCKEILQTLNKIEKEKCIVCGKFDWCTFTYHGNTYCKFCYTKRKNNILESNLGIIQ